MMMMVTTIMMMMIVILYLVASTNNHCQMFTLNEYINASFISGLSVKVVLSAAFGGVNFQQPLLHSVRRNPLNEAILQNFRFNSLTWHFG